MRSKKQLKPDLEISPESDAKPENHLDLATYGLMTCLDIAINRRELLSPSQYTGLIQAIRALCVSSQISYDYIAVNKLNQNISTHPIKQ